MASFDLTVDGACKGKPKDIENMERRLKALRDDGGNYTDPDWLRELFGDELDEIEGLDIEDEDSIEEIFGGLFMGGFDVDTLSWSGYASYDAVYSDVGPSGDIARMDYCLRTVFPRLKFDFIVTCYVSRGSYMVFSPDELDVVEYEWYEFSGGAEIHDAYINWRHAKRNVWLLDKDADKKERDAAEKEKADAWAAFLELKAVWNHQPDGETLSVNDKMTELLLAAVYDYFEQDIKTIDFSGRTKKIGFSEKLLEAVNSKKVQLENFNFEAEKFKPPEGPLKRYALAIEVIDDDFKYGWNFEYFPESLKTAEVCLEAVKHKTSSWEFVPDSIKTVEFYAEAVKNTGFVLKFVPEKLKNAEMCAEAVKNDGRALGYVPEKFKTAEICAEAVKQDGSNLEYVPEELKAKIEKSLKKPASKPTAKKPAAKAAAKKPVAAKKPAAASKKPATAKKPATTKKPAAGKTATKSAAAKGKRKGG